MRPCCEPARNMDEVITTDSLVEGVHFRRDWSPADAIGHKALAVNLSDLASMGASPRASLLSLALPADYPLADFDALVDGYLALAAVSGAVLVGGNMTRSPGPVVIDVTAIGTVGHRRVLRRGRRQGRRRVVRHRRAWAVLRPRSRCCRRADSDDRCWRSAADCLMRYERPDPRLRCGVMVGRSRAASAAIDLSDGLADAAGATRRGGRAGRRRRRCASCPCSRARRRGPSARAATLVALALAGGEDYELAFVVQPPTAEAVPRRRPPMSRPHRVQSRGVRGGAGRLVSCKTANETALTGGFTHF